jgi:dihydrofolate reductase
MQGGTEEVTRRKVVASELLSLDGVMESPERWSLQFHNDEVAEANASRMAASDIRLFDTVTCQEFASYWPYQNSAEQPYTDYLNNTPKYVLSTTLEEPLEWQNSTLIKGNAAEKVARLKRQPGKDIGIVGSGTLVRSLLRDGLLDEPMLMVHPVILGRGKRLFEDEGDWKALEVVESRTFGTGVLYLTYRLAEEQGAWRGRPRERELGHRAAQRCQASLRSVLRRLHRIHDVERRPRHPYLRTRQKSERRSTMTDIQRQVQPAIERLV